MNKGTIIILGATSGIGRQTALLMARNGWHVGAAGRRPELLRTLRDESPEGSVTTAVIDITTPQAPDDIIRLADSIGGADVILNCVGIGYTNPDNDPDINQRTLQTNVTAFTTVIDTAYRYMSQRPGGGHIAAITSVAATRGLGIAATYSASKRYQVNYLQAMAQLAAIQHNKILITDIRPGFTRTPLLDPGRRYPLLLSPQTVARHIMRAIRHRRHTVTIDWRWHLVTLLWRLIPGWIWRRLPVTI